MASPDAVWMKAEPPLSPPAPTPSSGVVPGVLGQSNTFLVHYTLRVLWYVFDLRRINPSFASRGSTDVALEASKDHPVRDLVVCGL
jgi:hypothetical protein